MPNLRCVHQQYRMSMGTSLFWPESWKREFVTVIEKEKDPQSKDDLRNISLTLFISKLVENLIYDLLIENFGDKLDTGQHGGKKKHSVL